MLPNAPFNDLTVMQASTLKRLATSIANLVNETLPEVRSLLYGLLRNHVSTPMRHLLQDLGMEEKLPRPLSDLMLRLNAFVSERSSSTVRRFSCFSCFSIRLDKDCGFVNYAGEG
jgi:hypothetical protein